MNPTDLVQLSLTCVTFEKILMAKRSKCLWKAARANVEPEGLPDCPEGMSEVEYEELVFGSQCQVSDAAKHDNPN